MSQFGMQMTSAQRKRASGPDVYTALAAVACLFLLVACVVMFKEASKVGKGGNAFAIQEAGPNKIQLNAEAPSR